MKRKIDTRTDEEKRAAKEKMAKVRAGREKKEREREPLKAAQKADLSEADSATEDDKPKETRRKRKPMKAEGALNFPQREGYHRHIFNDNEKGRVQAAKDAGYTVVMQSDIDGGDMRAGADSQLSSPVSRSVGGGMKGILMEIPQEFYDEDQKAKQDQIAADEKKRLLGPAITGNDREGYYGGVTVSDNRQKIV